MSLKTIAELEAELGEQIKSLRLRKDIDREALAEQAGVSVGALRNLEGGKGCATKTLIPVLRALGREQWLSTLTPQVTISPVTMTKTAKPRRRASGRATKNV